MIGVRGCGHITTECKKATLLMMWLKLSDDFPTKYSLLILPAYQVMRQDAEQQCQNVGSAVIMHRFNIYVKYL